MSKQRQVYFSGVNCPQCGADVDLRDVHAESGINDGEPDTEFEIDCSPAKAPEVKPCGARFKVHVDWEPTFTVGDTIRPAGERHPDDCACGAEGCA